MLAGEVAHVLCYYGLRGVGRCGKWAAGGMVLEVLVKEVSIGSGQVDRLAEAGLFLCLSLSAALGSLF